MRPAARFDCHDRESLAVRVDAGALGDLGEARFVEFGEPFRSDRSVGTLATDFHGLLTSPKASSAPGLSPSLFKTYTVGLYVFVPRGVIQYASPSTTGRV